jgi:TonB family protein
MRHTPSDADLFSIEEIAQAAGVSTDQVWNAVRMGQAVPYGRHFTTADAAHLLRVLKGLEPASEKKRAPITVTPDTHRRAGRGLAAAGFLHVFGVAVLLLMASLGLLSANDTEQELKDPTPIRLVYLMQPGPGGGGGGGGLKNPLPPPPAARKAVMKVVRKPATPVPRVRPRPSPPTPVPPPPRPDPPKPDPPKIEPLVVEPPKPPEPQAVKAPVASIPTDLYEAIGKLEQRQPSPPSQGPGTGGGVGTGSGVGVGEGTGGGIGPGTGGGTGGGPYQPGAGIDPPTVVREVRPTYTDEARRRAIEGDVLLEIIVRRDGSVGNVRVTRTLGAGLEQKAIDAVRQWRFVPAKKGGVPVDVVVDVAVEFKLRVP